MYKIINDFEKWFESREIIRLDLKHDIKSLEEYSIENELFFYDENMVKEKILRYSVFVYFNRIEEYIKKYLGQFSFISYENFNQLSENIKESDIVCFLDWIKEENIAAIKEFIKESNREKYDARVLYNAIRYYDYLIVENLENNNCESAMNFLVGFIDSVMNKAKELSEKKQTKVIERKNINIFIETSVNAKIIEEYLFIKTDQYTTNKFTNDFKSAEKQTFSSN